jgi:hypothetical protein
VKKTPNPWIDPAERRDRAQQELVRTPTESVATALEEEGGGEVGNKSW